MSQFSIEDTGGLLANHEEGDPEALDRLLRHYRPFLRRIVRVRMDPMLQGRVDPSDVIQEAQIEIIRRMDDYLRRRPMSFRAWLRNTVCQQLQIVWRRHRLAQKRTVDLEVSFDAQSSLALAQLLLGESPSQQVERLELAERVQIALAGLPERHREILVMRNFEALTNSETAEILGLSKDATSKRYARALLRLRQSLRGR
jgi:RNA polymerase sigma-70 factor (ECF subfamily)